MSNQPPKKESLPDDLHGASDDGEIERLLLEVGERVQPPPEMTAAVHAAVLAEWQAVVVQRARRKQLTQWSMAAGVAIVALTAVLLFRNSATTPVVPIPMASIVKIQSSSGLGSVQASANDGATWRDVGAGEVLSSGAVVRTDPTTRIALNFGKGRSVRLDGGTRLALLSADQVRLERGAAYIDASLQIPAPLTVNTAFGAVEHLGTQYQVQLTQERLTLSVREGKVAIAGKYGTAQLAANERVIYGEQGQIARESVASNDSSWSWAVQAAPAFDIDSHSLANFLEWVARESGRTVTYDTPQARLQAEQLILRGSVGNLTPDQALRAVLATTQFSHSDTGTVIRISL